MLLMTGIEAGLERSTDGSMHVLVDRSPWLSFACDPQTADVMMVRHGSAIASIA